MKKINIPDNISGLIFDLDGTLVDTMPIHFEAWKDACIKYNFEFPFDVFNELSGIPTRTIVTILNTRYGLTLDPEIIEKLKETAYLKNLSSVKTIQPVFDIVTEYYKKMKMSIGTGSRRHVAAKTLEASDLKRYFDIIVTADDVQHHKPHPDTFIKCAEEMSVPYSNCLVFEDGIQGLNAAEAAGMQAVDIRDFL